MNKYIEEIGFIRGDTLSFKFPIKKFDGSNIELDEIETLFITARREPYENSPILFQKKIEDLTIEEGYCHAEFKPADTEELCCPNYYFDISLTLKSGCRKTKVYKANLDTKTTYYKKGDPNGN